MLKIGTVLQDLDSHRNSVCVAEFKFEIKPGQTIIKDCTSKDEKVTFSWMPVNGATEYEFQVMDQDQQEYLVAEQTTKVSRDHGCFIELQSDYKLRIGRYCLAKVTAYMSNKKLGSTLRSLIIGGGKVVRNVTATLNKVDPYRSVDIAFDCPQDETAEHQYMAVAISSDDKRKMKIVDLTHLTFKYLKRGCVYYFKVSAKWGGEWSEESRSNVVKTIGNPNTSLTNIGSLSQTTIELQGSNIQGNTSINVYYSHTGHITNLCHTINKKHGKDEVTLTWQAPNFGSNTSDYKVELYRLEIFKNSQKILCIDTTETKYSTNLKWGEVYKVSVCAIYEYIDVNAYLMSSASELNIFTTPTQVQNVKLYHGDNRATSIKVHWDEVDNGEGAEEVCYDISLTPGHGRDGMIVWASSSPHVFNHLESHTSYHIKVRARNTHSAGNYSETASLTTEVGTPKNVRLALDPKNPSGQLVLSFSHTEGNDLHHLASLFMFQNEAEIEVENEKTVAESPFIFKNLHGNTEYFAKVWAKENDGTEGALVPSNKMKTAPNKPVVQEIKCLGSQNISLKWASDPGCHSHEVSISCNNQIECQLVVYDEHLKCFCRNEGHRYYVHVRSKNSSGYFGEASDQSFIDLAPGKIQFKEDLKFNDTEIVKYLHVEWNPLATTPEHYHLQLHCDGEKTGEPVKKQPTDEMQHTFEEDLKPGSFCYCTIQAFNGGQYGKLSKSRMCRIEWAKPDFFTVQHDEIDPTTKAVGTTREKQIILKNTIPGVKYKISVTTVIGEMRSDTAVSSCFAYPQTVKNLRASSANKIITFEWDELEVKPDRYEIEWRVNNGTVNKDITKRSLFTIDHIKTGDAYSLRVAASNQSGSAEMTAWAKFPARLAPSRVEGLDFVLTDDNLVIDWHSPQIKPDKYVVQWKVNNGRIKEEIMEYPPFRIKSYNCKKVYAVCVMGLNAAGRGPPTPWKSSAGAVPQSSDNDVEGSKDRSHPVATRRLELSGANVRDLYILERSTIDSRQMQSGPSRDEGFSGHREMKKDQFLSDEQNEVHCERKTPAFGRIPKALQDEEKNPLLCNDGNEEDGNDMELQTEIEVESNPNVESVEESQTEVVLESDSDLISRTSSIFCCCCLK